MKAKYIKIGVSCVFLTILSFLIYIFFFKTTYSGGAYTSVDVPPWLEGELSTVSSVIDKDSGPAIESDEDSYGVFKIRFYDASTQKLITDKSILNQLVSMFTYTNEPFIYDENRTTDGACFFYYDGILPANHSSSLFSGFIGNETSLLHTSKGIANFYLKVQASTIPSSFSDDLDEALDEF